MERWNTYGAKGSGADVGGVMQVPRDRTDGQQKGINVKVQAHSHSPFLVGLHFSLYQIRQSVDHEMVAKEHTGMVNTGRLRADKRHRIDTHIL